ncbi:MAG: hypothetical protein HRU18_11960 [Pseudoalteromonas sp.]|uniref:hypothetical protein n=1 Tax=Pseudoalteromonas sp. TaxID=53249 RepID=UPI001D22D7BB|nr:hypothetical protein [Pseudoalteromonas sp.]NRA78916.1 hypothetical protein [Pseudoalteromonas sp.]
MLPEERACFIDLLVYQHQHGIIPPDIKRVQMYCSGISEATLQATLQAKFEQTEKGWINRKLKKVTDEREAYASKQSENGLIGQFWKKAKGAISAKELKKLKDFIYNDYGKEKLIEELKSQTTHEATLKGLLKHLENEDGIEDGIENKVLLPWSGEFENFWNSWKEYKSKEHKFSYKSELSEQSALKKLTELSGGDMQTAIKIIERSIANGWKGFFKLDEPNKPQSFQDELEQRIDVMKQTQEMFNFDENGNLID